MESDEILDKCPQCGNECIPLEKVSLKNKKFPFIKSVVTSYCPECMLVSVTRVEQE